MKKVITVFIIIAILFVGAFMYINNKEENLDTKKSDVVENYYSNKDIWENKKSMKLAKNTENYEAGYCFLDIDLDGKKELAVQLGGGTLNNCTTNFYKYESGEISLANIFEETYSISVNDLKKYSSNNENFYINKYRLKVEPAKYITYYDKLVSGAKGVEVHNMLAREEIFKENGESTYNYLVEGTYVDRDTYYNAYDNLINYSREEVLIADFISFNEWQKLSEDEQKEFLENSYSDETLEYVLDIKNNIISEEVNVDDLIIENDVLITEEMSKDQIEKYKKIANVENIFAQIVTDKSTFVEIIPNSELIDEIVYYYKDGRKVAYQIKVATTSKTIDYYLKDGKIVYVDTNRLDESRTIMLEDETDLALRANKIYSKYIK